MEGLNMSAKQNERIFNPSRRTPSHSLYVSGLYKGGGLGWGSNAEFILLGALNQGRLARRSRAPGKLLQRRQAGDGEVAAFDLHQSVFLEF